MQISRKRDRQSPPKVRSKRFSALSAQFLGENSSDTQPLTRLDCKSYYQLRGVKKVPAQSEMLTDVELAQVLLNYTIHHCFAAPDDYLYEIMENEKKKYKTVHGQLFYSRDVPKYTDYFQ
jgi:hypothetical protein